MTTKNLGLLNGIVAGYGAFNWQTIFGAAMILLAVGIISIVPKKSF